MQFIGHPSLLTSADHRTQWPRYVLSSTFHKAATNENFGTRREGGREREREGERGILELKPEAARYEARLLSFAHSRGSGRPNSLTLSDRRSLSYVVEAGAGSTPNPKNRESIFLWQFQGK